MRFWSRRIRDRVFGVVFVVLVVLTAVRHHLARSGRAMRSTASLAASATPGSLSADGRRWFRMDEHRQDVPLADIPPHLQHAFVAVEDHRFYAHPGVDPDRARPRRLAQRASPGTVEGGSTLTQQLARTLFLSNKKTYGRKVREGVLALMIDAQLSKDQVLELI